MTLDLPVRCTFKKWRPYTYTPVLFVLLEHVQNLQSWTKVLRHFTKTNAFKLTIIFCVWMKTPFSSVILPRFPQPMLQMPRGCLFVSNIEKGGRGGYLSRGDNSHQGKKVGHCRMSQRLLSMIVAVRCSHLQNVQNFRNWLSQIVSGKRLSML